MNSNKLFDGTAETEQLSNTQSDGLLEQDANETIASESSVKTDSSVSEQSGEKKQRRKRTKKSEGNNIAAIPVKSEDGNTSDIEPESDTQGIIEESTSDKQYRTGDAVDIRLALLYVSSAAPKHFRGIRGKYYIWSDMVVNGRIRLTDSPSGVGKPERVIGWANVKNIL